MASQHKTTQHNNIVKLTSPQLESEPLKLDELLNLIMLANEFGYTVKSARDMKSGDNPILAEIYSIWFGIENELSIFAHNVPWLMQFTRMKYPKISLNGQLMAN